MSHPAGDAAEGDKCRQTLLQEVFAHDYQVTDQEVAEYCEKLGISSKEKPHLVPLARAALLHPLPSRWTPVEDPQLGLYFFNRHTGESRWNHPIDTIVRSLITGEKNNNTPYADSLTEDLDEEELQISEFLKAHVSDEKGVHSDGNLASEYTTTDAFTFTSQCLRASEGPLLRPPQHTDRPVSVTSTLDALDQEFAEKKSVSGIEDGQGSDAGESKGKESGVLVPSEGEGNAHAAHTTQQDISVGVKELNTEEERRLDSVHENRDKACEAADVTRAAVANSGAEDAKQWTEQTEGPAEEHGQSSTSPQRPSTASNRDRGAVMFTGRDGLGRGLGRSSLGTPSSLAAPPPLGRPSFGGSPMGGARVPPIGGQLTPLAPIAAASKGGSSQLAPLKPVGSISQQQPRASKEGPGSHTLRRPATVEQQGREGGGWPEKQTGEGRRGGEDRGHGDGTDQGLSSPPKSILKGPVLARGSAGRGQSQGVDRMQLLQPKEAKNIRFDFRTDDLEFHTSEEEYDEELDEEEEEEEEEDGEDDEDGDNEEEEYEDEEEYDSEAEDLEEEAMYRERHGVDERSIGSGLMLQDASDLLLSRPAPVPLKRQPTLPHGPDPWAAEYPEKLKPQDKAHDPLRDFRKEKDNVEKEAKKQSETVPLQPQQTKPFESSHTNTRTPENRTLRSSSDNTTVQNQQNIPKSAVSSGSKPQQNVPANQNAMNAGMKTQNIKTLEPKQQEERKLELEGAPKNRKVNPLDRVVAKLSGKTEEKSGREETKAAGTVKNVTVNLTQLMTNKDESEEDDSSGDADDDGDDDSQPEVKISSQDLKQKTQVEAKQQEAEVSELRRQHETQLKTLKEQLNQEYQTLQDKLRQEHNTALNKLKDQERKTFESSQNQVLQKVKEENRKHLSEAKARLEGEHAEKKTKLLEDLEKKTEEELEQLKIEFVRDMQQRKEELLQEHEEEMQELEEDLKELYSQQKTSKQEELDAATRSSNDSAAAAALSELELSMAEVLRQRQTQIKREHNRQLATLEEKLDEELERAARQAKERETVEKRNHSSRLIALKDEHERELAELEDSYARHIQDLEAKHETDVNKLKSEFRAELMRQKTELENKLTEFRIEYEQKMDSLAQEGQAEEGGEASEERSVELSAERRQDREDVINEAQEQSRTTPEGITGSKKRVEDEEKKYDEILIELQARRRSLEGDLEELKTQENKVKELRTQHMANSHSHCHKNCIHETKYNHIKAKYSSLVNRIKSKKAKRSSSSRPSPVTHNTPSLSSDKSSMESNANVWDSGQASTDPTLSTTSPRPHHPTLHRTRHLGSPSEASEDEEIRYATEILEKYNKASGLQNGHMKHRVTSPMSSTPRKAWAEDELLTYGRKELNRAEKFLKSRRLKNHREMKNVTTEDIHREMLRQNAKTGHGHTSVVYGGSITSDTESDEPTHDVPSPASDFGLDRMLEQIGSANKRSQGRLQQHSSRRRHDAPYPTGSLEFGLNNPLNTHSSGPLRLEHLTSGSVPDLGPETVDRIANVNHYLQQRWTSYFGELSVPLGGKVGWPAQVIGQSTLLDNKATPTLTDPNIPEKERRSFFMADGTRQKPPENAKNVNERIDDLRAWLQEAQATSVSFYDQ